MGGVSYRLSQGEKFSAHSLRDNLKVGAIAGGTGGVVNAEANALMDHKLIASPRNILSSAENYAVLGGLMAAAVI